MSIGRTAHTGGDDAYLANRVVLARHGLRDHQVADFVEGDKLRDWALSPQTQSAFPYGHALRVIGESPNDSVIRWLWPYRTMLWERREPQGTHREIGFTWHQYSRFHPERFEGRGVAFAFVATHNHFVLDRGGKVFNRSAPVIKLPAAATEDDHLGLLGLLNSSTGCFSMKQVSHCKGSQGVNEGAKSELWEQFYEFDATKLKLFPIPKGREAIVPWAHELDRLARMRASRSVEAALADDGWSKASELRVRLVNRREADTADLIRMVALQEELDWECYRLYGLDGEAKGVTPEQIRTS